MAKTTNASQTAEFETVWRNWWAKTSIPTSLPAGTVLRVDVLAMIGDVKSWTASATQSLIETLVHSLDDILAGKATMWSLSTGLIDIYYAAQSRQAAELKHSVVESTVERCVRSAMGASAAADSEAKPAVVRRVDWETFQAVCAKAKARTDQILILDVGEAIFGAPEPEMTLSQRIWHAVDEILDEHLAGGGYCTRYPRNQVLLFFPGYSKSMGELKRKSIAGDIAGTTRPLLEKGRDAKDNAGADSPPNARTASPPVRRGGSPRPAADPDEAQANQAFAAMAAARNEDKPDPSELELGPEFDIRPVPMWWAKKRTVGGYVMETVRKTGAEWDRYFPATIEEMDALDLPLLLRGIARIHEQLASGKSSLVVVQVHWAYLDRAKQRDRYLTICARLPETARRLLVFELVGMPEDLMQARVEERIVQVKHVCRAIMCRVRLGRRDFSQFKKLPVYAIGVDLGELPAYERGIIPGFDAFMDAVEPYKLQTYIGGLTTKSLLIAAQAAGVDYIAGPIIPESEQAPLGIHDFTISDLYDVSNGN